MPAALVPAFSRGARLFELSQCGATFVYPDGLAPEDWDYLVAANRGWNRHEREEMKRLEEERERDRR